jgi:hypothetical protein
MINPGAIGLGLVTACICGMALWPLPTHAAPLASRVATPAARPPVAGPAGSEAAHALVLLSLLPTELRQRAVVAEAVDGARFLTRSVPASAIVSDRGVLWSELDPAAAAVVQSLCEHFAAAQCAAGAANELARIAAAGRDRLAVAIAGSPAEGAACYLRLHGEHFAVEWLRTADGKQLARWRDFVGDAAAPWFGDDAVKLLAGG